jgi:putative hydrolase of the HAD superfamily
MQKLAASKLQSCFEKVDIVAEKNEALYRELVRKHGWEPGRCWMIGNSPRSDINPAIAAGIRAVYIPHPNTWVYEHEEPVEHPHVLRLSSFSELPLHF